MVSVAPREEVGEVGWAPLFKRPWRQSLPQSSSLWDNCRRDSQRSWPPHSSWIEVWGDTLCSPFRTGSPLHPQAYPNIYTMSYMYVHICTNTKCVMCDQRVIMFTEERIYTSCMYGGSMIDTLASEAVFSHTQRRILCITCKLLELCRAHTPRAHCAIYRNALCAWL